MLKQTIRPEFLNRVDETIMFLPLTIEEVREIVKLQVTGVINRLEKSGINLELSNQALDFLAKLGYDPQFGARPIKRVIQRELLNKLSRDIIAGTLHKSDKIMVDVENGNLLFTTGS
jgi:ATP-dependent Clp protease ATP-binding subunit ClpB